MQLINKLIDKLPVELHAPGYQFCGPGTKLRTRLAQGERGINKLDQACRLHDVAYAEHSDLESRRRADLELSRAAGERFRAGDSSLGEKLTAAAVKTAMVVKRKIGAGVRRAGHKRRTKRATRVLPVARFGAGRRRRRRGGFVAPLAAAITAGISAVKTIKDIRNAKRLLEEKERHHRALEQIAHQRGVRVGSGGKRSGGKLRKKKGKCARRTIRFL